MYSRWEDGCIYSEGSLHAAGHQGTDKLDVKCGWQVCNWHHFSNCPIQPFLTFPACHPKSSLAREFAQFCSYLPHHRHFVAWGPGRLLSCRMAGNVRHSASGRSLGAQGKQQVSFPGTHCSLESSPLLNARGNLPVCALLHSTSHIDPVCIWVPALHFVWKIRDSLPHHALQLPPRYSPEQKIPQIGEVLPKKGERDTL